MKTLRLISLLVLASCAFTINSSGYSVRVWNPTSSTSTNAFPGVTNVIAIAGGWSGHLLALRSDGSVLAWGNNYYGETDVPAGLSNTVAVAAGLYGSMALRADGTVVLWGTDPVLKLSSTTPAEATNVVAIDVSFWGAAAIREDGRLLYWGLIPQPPELTNVVTVSISQNPTTTQPGLALLSDQTVAVWGSLSLSNVVSQLTNIIAVEAGYNYNLVLRADGRPFAWGYSLVDSGVTNVPADLTNAIGIAAGWNCSLALRSDGTIAAWGSTTNVPADVPHAIAVATGNGFNAALVSDGAVYPPAILGSPFPQNQTALVGSTAYLTVHVAGAPPLIYQWYFGPSAIPGATNATLKLENLLTAQSGAYTVAVSNVVGQSVSSPAFLSVMTSLDIVFVPRITLKADPGSSYRLEYLEAIGPTNNWISLRIVNIVSNPQFYYDDSAIGKPQRLYRLSATNAP